MVRVIRPAVGTRVLASDHSVVELGTAKFVWLKMLNACAWSSTRRSPSRKTLASDQSLVNRLGPFIAREPALPRNPAGGSWKHSGVKYWFGEPRIAFFASQPGAQSG